MLGEEGVMAVVVLLVLAPMMVAVVLPLMVMMLRNLHLDFPRRRMRSTSLGVVLIFVTCFFRAERARERIEFAEEAISVGDGKCKWGLG